LGRTVAPADNRGKLALIALAISFGLFPPFHNVTLWGLFALAPTISLAAAVFIVLLAVLFKLDAESLARRIFFSAAFAAILLYGITVEPIWSAMMMMSMVPFAATVVLIPFRWRSFLNRAVPLVVILLLFYAVGAVDYLLGTMNHSSRVYFRDEMWGVVRGTDHAYFAFTVPRFFRFFLFLMGGILLALWHRTRTVRILAIASIVTIVFCGIYTLAWWFYPRPWSLPLAAYLDVFTIPVFALVAILGWLVLLERGLAAISDRQCRKKAVASLRLMADRLSSVVRDALASRNSARRP
jgi:hypothetical protein